MLTRNALYGVSSPTGLEGGQEGAEAHQTRRHEYEDVDVPKSTKRTKELQVSSAGEEKCSAYGANN